MNGDWEILKHLGRAELPLPETIRIRDTGSIHLPRRLVHKVFGKQPKHKIILYFSPELKQLHISLTTKDGEDVQYLSQYDLLNTAYYSGGFSKIQAGAYPFEISAGKIIVKGVIMGEEKKTVLATPLQVPTGEHRRACMFCEGDFIEREKYPHKEFVCYDCALIKAFEERQIRASWRSEISKLVQRTITLQKAISAPFQYPPPEDIIKEMESKGLRKTEIRSDKA